MKANFDCIIIGAGVAGMTSAIYLKRSGINVCIIEKNYIGGQINKTNFIKNYPGFKEIDGPTLALQINEQLKELEIPIIYEEVNDIVTEDEIKIVKTNKNEYRSSVVVIATGRQEKYLNLDHEKELIGHGVSWCATCDGNLFKNKIVAVIGGGNTAMEDALYLSGICKQVYVINRSEQFRADKILLEQVKSKENIEIIANSVVKTLIVNNQALEGIKLDNNREITLQGMFIAIGSTPVTSFAQNLNLSLDNDYIVVNNQMETSAPGIYACGDVIKKDLYQIVTATSEGAIAANSIKKFLNR